MWVELRNGAMINLNKVSFFRKVNDQEDKNNPDKDLFAIEYIIDSTKPLYETFSSDIERNIRLEFIKYGLLNKNHYVSIAALDTQIKVAMETMQNNHTKQAESVVKEMVKGEK